MNNTLIFFIAIVLFLSGCNNERKKDKIITAPVIPAIKSIVSNLDKPTVNVYVENSGSMDGYVRGVTDFEQIVYNYLTDIIISDYTDSLNLFYINSDIIPQGSDISDFIERLEPSTFRIRGGNRGISDISNVLKTILSETQENEIAILVTDGIFSPGKDRDAAQYLTNQQIGIKRTFADYLESYPNTSVLIYHLTSQFEGYFYNREDSRVYINSLRPFFIWVIGNNEQLDNLCSKVPVSKFKGGGVKNIFTSSRGNKNKNYAIKLGSGRFDLDKTSPKTTIMHWKKDSKGKQNSARISVDANLSGFLLDDNYLKDINNYEINNKDLLVTINKAVSNPFGYTHTFNLSSEIIKKGTTTINLKAKIPKWVEEVNDDDGTTQIVGKTYGIKYQIQGVYEAFTNSNDSYTEIKINIK
ncbi:MAG: hypothetical protein JXA54_15900 [Candidatus Heimdallarchaeota archaeon]|nr:hypothetical protein [Candidatus Heimdallarchaeota archaeon]